MNKFVYVLFLGGLLMLWSCKGTKTTNQKTTKKDIINTDVPAINKFVPATDKLLYEDTEIIKKIQVILFLNNYQTGRVNGEMTSETLRALTAFQQDNNIKVGDRSATTLNAIGVKRMDFDVTTLQQVLNQKGFDAGVVDGILGPRTRTAYQTFLRKNNLKGLGLTEDIKVALMQSIEAKKETNTNQSSSFVPPKSNPAPMPKPTANIDIQQVQQALMRKGYDPGDIDGILSPQTQDALFKYQVDKKLPIGGFNEDTMKSLGL
ncbi:MAG: peptidoglycan-binding protein [Chitinophagales bacterium]